MIVEANWSTTDGLMGQLKKNSVDLKTETICTEILPDGIMVKNSQGGAFIKADTVMYAVGMKAKKAEAEKFRDLAMDFFMVGDCVKPDRIRQAVFDAYNAAMDIR